MDRVENAHQHGELQTPPPFAIRSNTRSCEGCVRGVALPVGRAVCVAVLPRSDLIIHLECANTRAAYLLCACRAGVWTGWEGESKATASQSQQLRMADNRCSDGRPTRFAWGNRTLARTLWGIISILHSHNQRNVLSFHENSRMRF